MEFASINWSKCYASNNNSNTVNILLNFDTIEQLDTIIKMGFKEGFTMGLNQLDKLLAIFINK